MSNLIERVQAFTDSTRERWSGNEMSMATTLLEEVIDELTNLQNEVNTLKTSDKVFMETYDELMKVQAANHALHALENDKILELKRINADLRSKIDLSVPTVYLSNRGAEK